MKIALINFKRTILYMNNILLRKIIIKASEQIIRKEKDIMSSSYNYIYENDELRKKVENIRFMIDNLKLDLDICTKKSKTYLINKILSLKELETQLYNKISFNRDIINTIENKAAKWRDILSDEYLYW